MSKKRMLGRFLTSTMLTGVAATAAAPAFAQDEEAASDDRIVVTGSRIARQDLAAPSPLTSVDAATLEVTNTVNAEDFLNDLPQLIPSFDSTSNNPGDGTARLSLRNLGSVRTLILLDGKRMVPEGISGVVDINNVPAALVERVDVVTGGASAVYGSDAVAGVVNFILKDDFEGVELNSTWQTTGKGDAETLNINAVVGGNFADGRGNAVAAFSYTNRQPLFQGDRDFSEFTFTEDFNPATPFGRGGSSSGPGGRFFTGAFGNFVDTDLDTAGNQTGSGTFDATTGSFRQFSTAQTGNDFYNYAPTNYLQLPQERYNISTFANYEIMDGIEVYARGIFSHVLVDQQLAPTPVATTLTIESDNPWVFGGAGGAGAAEFGAILVACGAACGGADSNGNGTVDYQFIPFRRMVELGTRNSLRDTNTFLVGGGIRGSLGDNDNWQWDVYGQYARSSVNLIQTGNISISAYRASVLDGSANIFGFGSVDPTVAEGFSRTGAINQVTENVQILATLGGEIESMQSPWASSPVATSVGLEYREEASLQIPDSVLGPDVAGFNQSVFVQGRYDVYEAFGEVDIPLISDMEFVQLFSINGGYRYSDYSTVGGVSSYFVGGTWQIVDDIRLRSQFQRAVRAPNISELFITPGNGFPGAGDPCSGTVGSSFGLWQGLDAAQQATVMARCIADGVPMANVGANLQTNGQVQLIFSGFGSTLEAEKADTLTVGAVITPTMVDGLTMTVDYFDIKIANAIGFPSAQSILDECFLFNIASACAYTNRGASGALLASGAIGTPANPVLNENQVLLTQRGIDLGISYSFDIPGDMGSFAWRFDGTYTMEAGQQGSPGASFFDCVGLYSGVCGEPTPEWKFTTLGTWTFGPAAASVRYNWISGVEDAATVRYLAYAGKRNVASIGSYGTLDLTLQYDVTEELALTLGVTNVLDADLPILGSCCSEQANTFPGTYETLGRQFFAGGTLRF